MKNKHFNRNSFILMGLVLIEMIALVQAVFSQQVVKYNIEQQLENTSEMLLSQFVNSYEMNSAFQNNIIKLSYQHFDKGLIEIYTDMAQSFKTKGTFVENKRYTNENGDYQIEIRDNTQANRNIYMEQFGVNVNEIETCKIISYEMKQSDELLLERRVLIGVSKEQKKIITIEIELKSLQEKIAETNQKIDELLNSAYYFGDYTGNFYVFESSGKALYQGGGEKNAHYFNNVDLNTNKKIIDIIRQESKVYQPVIYEKNDEIKRSMLRIHYDKTRHLYFVYEYNQKKVFQEIEQKMFMTWIVSLVIIVGTLALMVLLKVAAKQSIGE